MLDPRAWIGTPFRPQQSVRGEGADCKGFVAGVLRDAGRAEAGSVHALALDYSLARVPGRRLREGMAELFDRVDAIREGDILLHRIGGTPAHLSIVTGDDSAVHASVERGVRETKLRALAALMPIDSAWRLRC